MCLRKLLSFCFILIFISCKKESIISFTDSNITTKNNTIVNVNVPVAYGDEKVSSTINTSIKNIIISSLKIGNNEDSPVETIEENITLFNNEYSKFIKDFPESELHWEAQIDGEVLYQTPEIISITVTSYVNTGGAHGNLSISIKNFDALTGNLISNENLFKDLNGFKKVALPYFKKIVKEKEIGFEADSFKLPQNIGYTDEGIILLYNTYEIAPYSAGIIEFTIPYSKANSVLIFESS